MHCADTSGLLFSAYVRVCVCAPKRKKGKGRTWRSKIILVNIVFCHCMDFSPHWLAGLGLDVMALVSGTHGNKRSKLTFVCGMWKMETEGETFRKHWEEIFHENSFPEGGRLGRSAMFTVAIPVGLLHLRFLRLHFQLRHCPHLRCPHAHRRRLHVGDRGAPP